MSLANTLPVTLGGLQLSGLEVPSFFDRAGRVRVAAHPVVGGGRVLQVTGYDPVKRELNGIFIGADAAERAQTLEAMRDQAEPLLLTIGAWAELVLMTSVVIRYAERGSVVAYLVQAEVVSDATTAYIQTEEAVVAASISNLAISASLLADFVGQSVAVAAVQTGLSSAGTALSNSLSGGATGTADLTTPGLGLMSVINTSGSSLVGNGVSTQSSDLVTDAPGLSAATGNAGLLAAATCSGAYLNQASSQLASLNGSTFEPVVYS